MKIPRLSSNDRLSPGGPAQRKSLISDLTTLLHSNHRSSLSTPRPLPFSLSSPRTPVRVSEDKKMKRQFLLVFQCIEIERLNEQLSFVRNRLHQKQKSLYEIRNFQVQIQQLTQKCAEYEGQIKQYQIQQSKMDDICMKLYTQNEKLKQQMRSLKQMQVKDAQNLKVINKIVMESESSMQRILFQIQKLGNSKELNIQINDYPFATITQAKNKAQNGYKNQYSSEYQIYGLLAKIQSLEYKINVLKEQYQGLLNYVEIKY